MIIFKKCFKKLNIVKNIKKNIKKEFIMTKEHEKNFQMPDECHVCDKLYDKKGFRLRDHCHVKRKYRDSAHQIYNTNFYLQARLKLYDGHLIIQKLISLVRK